MNSEVKAILKKSVKVACVTCASLGAVALVASGAAVKAATEGGKLLVESVKKIVKEGEKQDIVDAEVVKTEETAQEAAAEEAAAEEEMEEAPAEEVIVLEETV